jgi:hypothetical protein
MLYPPPLSVLAPSCVVKDGNVSLSKRDFERIMYLILSTIYVDEEWYLKNNPDVVLAIKNGEVSSPAEHYRQGGYFEGRMPFATTVDERWYVEEYPDVQQAIAQEMIENATVHFVSSGHNEGRLPREFPVDADWYLAQYERARRRVADAVSANAEEDFVKFGYREGYWPHRPANTAVSYIGTDQES